MRRATQKPSRNSSTNLADSIIAHLKNNGETHSEHIREALGLESKQQGIVRSALKRLATEGVILRRGEKRNTTYRINPKANKRQRQ